MANQLVYVPNRAAHDYSKAWKYGELLFCTEGVLNRKDILTMYSELSKKMEDSQEDDYILMSSLTSICCIACAIFVNKHKRLNILLFEDGEYIERTLSFT
jgi:hypothetical protein